VKDEAAFKLTLKKSIKAHGGFCISLAAPMINGIPDQYWIFPGYAPLLIEAKWLKDTGLGFSRKVQYRPLQEDFIKKCHNILNYSAQTIIGLKYSDEYYAVLLEYNNPLFNQFSFKFLETCTYTKYDPKTKLFNVVELLMHSKSPRMTFHVTPLLTQEPICNSIAVSLTKEQEDRLLADTNLAI